MTTPQEWHQRFAIQAAWTESVRKYLFSKLTKSRIHKCLDLGCGTGALFPSMRNELPEASFFGIDLDWHYLNFAVGNNGVNQLANANAYYLPYPKHTFDLIVMHYFLLWTGNPLEVLREAFRVLNPQGALIAFAEPDYEGRIDYPEELEALGDLQRKSLSVQGANTSLGRKLGMLFGQIGLEGIVVGLLGNEWHPESEPIDLNSEWKMLKQDLEIFLNPEQIQYFRNLDYEAWQNGSRVLYIPTFFASGYKPT